MTLSVEVSNELQLQGANACALGRSRFDNPFTKHAKMMPGATGETIAEWTEKIEAWELGWAMEDAIRGQTAPLKR